MNALRLYTRYASISVRGQLQYRASVIMQSIGILLITGIEFLGILALFDRFGQIRGWTLPEVSLFYGMVSIAWALCDAFARGFEVNAQTVKAGDFDRILLRPRSTVVQMLGHELTLRRVGRLAQGVAVLIYAFVALDIDWSLARALLLVLAIVGTICVFMGLLVLEATAAFWTIETTELWNAFTYGGVTMAQYPLSIYRSWFRRVFMFAIPIGTACYLPGLAIMGHADPLGTPIYLHWLAPLVGPIFLALAFGAWRIGIRHYQSTGS